MQKKYTFLNKKIGMHSFTRIKREQTKSQRVFTYNQSINKVSKILKRMKRLTVSQKPRPGTKIQYITRI